MTACVNGGADAGINGLAGIVSGVLLLKVTSSLAASKFTDFDAGSDAAAVGARVEDDVASVMDIGTGADIDVVEVIVVGALLLLWLSSFFSSVDFVSIGFDTGSDAAATGDDVEEAVGEGMDV